MSASTISNNSRTIVIQNASEQQSQHHSRSQQSGINQSSSQQQLQKLKQSLQLSKQDLIQLTNKNQFSEKVFCFNNEAKKLIENNKIEEALLYLNEAEKILEYAASSGKNIERRSIVEVLHNQACCYQILWDLQKCSNYIEALIFNFNSELKFGDLHSTNPSEIHMSSSKKSLPSCSKIEAQKMQKKIQLTKYYLLYCAINSQLKNNQGALVAAKKASEITKDMMQELLDIYEEQKLSTITNHGSSIQNLPPFVYLMLQEIPKITTSINVNKTDELLDLVRHYIKIYNSKCVFNNLSTSKNLQSSIHTKEVYQKYKNFSIGNIMQLQPVGDTSESFKNIMDSNYVESSYANQRISYEKLIEKLIVFSICQFTMATQLRYIALNNAKNDKEKSRQMIEFKESQAFHLLSILIVAMYMPFDIIYMEHIISSYHGHYKTVLLSNGLEDTPNLSEDEIKMIKEAVIFTPHKDSNLTSTSSRKQEDTKKCSTTTQSNNSMIVSFHQEDQDDDSKQQSHKKSNQSSYNKKSLNKKDHDESSFVNDQNDLSESERRLFDDYYYVKKNTEPDHGNGLAYEQNNSKKQSKLLNVKSRSKSKKTVIKSNSKKIVFVKNFGSKSKLNTEESIDSKENRQEKKQSRKSKSKSIKQSCFNSKPSTIFIQSESHKESQHYGISQVNPQSAYSPVALPQIYSKITKKSKPKQSKSKQIKIKTEKKNLQVIRHQCEYFNKCDFNKKNDNNSQKKNQNTRPINEKRSKSNKKKQDKARPDPNKLEYFHVHDQNILRNAKSGQKKPSYNEGRKSTSKNKKQRLSSKSLHKALSPTGLSKRSSKMMSEVSKQKRGRQTEGFGSKYLASAITGNRQSVSSKKSERHTIHKLGNLNRLATEESTKTMKGSHFDKYYL